MAEDRYPDRVYDRAAREMDDHEERFMAALRELGVFLDSPNMDVALHSDGEFYVESSVWMPRDQMVTLWDRLRSEGLDYEIWIIVAERGEPTRDGERLPQTTVYPAGGGPPEQMFEFDPSWDTEPGKEYAVSFFLNQDMYVFAENTCEDMLEDGSLTRNEMNAWLEAHGRAYRV